MLPAVALERPRSHWETRGEGGGENRTSPGRPRAMASAFPIRPGNRRDDGRPPDVPMVHMSADGEGEGELVPLPSIDISKISFAAMGGSAEDLRHAFPENDVAYDVDSSDEDLDGMEAAVERYERRAAERASLKAAAEANEDAARRLASETRETARAVESLREQRRRFEEARAVAERGGASPDNPKIPSSIPGADERDDEDIDDEDRQLIELRERRRRVDERIARLLQEASSYDRTKESEKESVDELALAVNDRERRRVMEEEVESRRFDEGNDYVPRWKRRQEERWAREAAEAAAALERAEIGNTTGHATIAPPSPLYAVPATEPVAKDRRIEDERIKHEAAAPARGHHARPPTAISAGDDLADAARAIVENRAEDFARALSHLTSLVDARDEAGDTLLHLAASLDRKRCVKTLVRAGADAGARNDAGVSVVETAIAHERFELADYLVKWCERHGVGPG